MTEPPDFVDPALAEVTYSTICGDCDRVLVLYTPITETPLTPCWHCGSRRGPDFWPTVGTAHSAAVDARLPRLEVLGEFFAFTRAKPDEAGIVAVFLCAALEAVLHRSLAEALRRYRTQPAVVEAVLARVQGRNDCLRLFAALAGQKAKVILDRSLYVRRGWMADWEALVQNRNQVAHGQGDVADLELVGRVRQGMIPALGALHNALMAAADEAVAASPWPFANP